MATAAITVGARVITYRIEKICHATIWIASVGVMISFFALEFPMKADFNSCESMFTSSNATLDDLRVARETYDSINIR